MLSSEFNPDKNIINEVIKEVESEIKSGQVITMPQLKTDIDVKSLVRMLEIYSKVYPYGVH